MTMKTETTDRIVFARATMGLLAQQTSQGGLPRFEIVASTGVPMVVEFWDQPVLVDLSGVAIPKQTIPLRFMHRPDAGVGHTDTITVTADHILKATGVVSRATPEAEEVVASAKNGFPWQASVGLRVHDYRFVQPNESVTANGRTWSGPLYLVTRSTLYEISLVDLGGDMNTEARLISAHAGKECPMDDTQHPTVTANADGTHAPQPAARPETTPGTPDGAAAITGPARAEVPAAAAEPPPPDYDAQLKRFQAVKAIFGPRTDLAEKAILERWSLEQCQLEALRSERPQGPAIHMRQETVTPQILTCAMRMQGLDRTVEKDYPPQILEAAAAYRGLSLVKLAYLCASLDGATLPVHARPLEVVQAAFSTRTLANVLKEAAQKILLDGYQAIGPAAVRVARILEAVDFKTHTLARLTGQYKMEKVAPDGELPHAEISDQGFSIKVDTYGRLVGLTRQDVINDDLGAFLDLPRQIGRGAALALESAFWAMVEAANGTFFAAANGNVISGASSAFGIGGLNAAIAKLRKQKDADGNPILARPRYVAIPPDLEADATQIYTSNVLLIAGSSDRTVAANNPHANKYEPVVSEFLTGNGASSVWYLIADPADVPAFGVAFLRGQQTPIIEEAQPDPKYLGQLFRGYFDFGVALLDPRGAVRAAGA